MNWLVANWSDLLPRGWVQVALALVALVGGAIVGAEREKREKPAGLRTLMLVCLGSAVFTMVSYAFGTTTGDTGRVAAQIVTGIGFLGAGVILHGRTAISGITTAATVWAAAAVGMAIGVGYAGAGLGLSILIRGALAAGTWWEQRYVGELHPQIVELKFEAHQGKTRFRLERVLVEFHVTGPLRPTSSGAEGIETVRLEIRLPQRQRVEFLAQIAGLEEVLEMREIGREPNTRLTASD